MLKKHSECLECVTKKNKQEKLAKSEEKISTNEENAVLRSAIQVKQKKIQELRNENMQVEERLEEFLNNTLKRFDKDTNKSEVREVYHTLWPRLVGRTMLKKLFKLSLKSLQV